MELGEEAASARQETSDRSSKGARRSGAWTNCTLTFSGHLVRQTFRFSHVHTVPSHPIINTNRLHLHLCPVCLDSTLDRSFMILATDAAFANCMRHGCGEATCSMSTAVVRLDYSRELSFCGFSDTTIGLSYHKGLVVAYIDRETRRISNMPLRVYYCLDRVCK